MTTNDSIPDDGPAGPGADVHFLFKWRLLWKAEGEIFLTFNKGLSTYDPLRYGKYLYSIIHSTIFLGSVVLGMFITMIFTACC
jgi:hypothetical protein